MNSTESDKKLDASASNGSDGSICSSFGSNVPSSTPSLVSNCSPTPQISPILNQDTNCSDSKTAGNYNI